MARPRPPACWRISSDHAGLEPGFLIGGVPGNFEVSARLGKSPFFVIEADEYDTAFFDKRAKFVHYRPRTLVLNNLEFDHADIYRDLEAIKQQFNHLLRIVPGSGLVVHNAADANLDDVIARGCWTPREGFAWRRSAARELERAPRRCRPLALRGAARRRAAGHGAMGHAGRAQRRQRAGRDGRARATPACRWRSASRRWRNSRACGGAWSSPAAARGISIYDDFAHHPTAIATTIEGLRRRVGKARLVAVLEARSNTMRMGVHKDTLAPSLAGADAVYLFAPPDLGWDAGAVARAVGAKAATEPSIEALLARLRRRSARRRPGAHHEQRRLRRPAPAPARGLAGADRERAHRTVPARYGAVSAGRCCRCASSKPATSTWSAAACARSTGFGVVLIHEGAETGPVGALAAVGTYARIVDFGQLPDGLLSIVARGERRFRLVGGDLQKDGLHLGDVEWLDDEPARLAEDEYTALRATLVRVLADLGGGLSASGPARPEDALWVAGNLGATAAGAHRVSGSACSRWTTCVRGSTCWSRCSPAATEAASGAASPSASAARVPAGHRHAAPAGARPAACRRWRNHPNPA